MQTKKTAFVPFSRPSNSLKFFSTQGTNKPVCLDWLSGSTCRLFCALKEPEEAAEDGENNHPGVGICLIPRAIDVSPLPTHRAKVTWHWFSRKPGIWCNNEL